MSLPCIIYKFIYHISSASNILSYCNIITQHASFYKKKEKKDWSYFANSDNTVLYRQKNYSTSVPIRNCVNENNKLNEWINWFSHCV